MKFFISPVLSSWGTADPSWSKRDERKGAKSIEVTVDGVTFCEILRRFGVPYYLKVDIEGADILCLRGLKDVRGRPRYVSVEAERSSWKRLFQEMALFKELGYSKFKVVQQSDVPHQSCPMPAREGIYVKHRFEAGSSGLFGNEIPGSWLGERQALMAYRRIFLRSRLFGEEGLLQRSRVGRSLVERMKLRVGWYDTHASL
jgi:hypothetical protein